MREDHVEVYLNDHLAGLVLERELAARCESNNRDTPLGEFLLTLSEELNDQEAAVRELLRRLGGSESTIKQSAAWLAEKLGRLKRNNSILKYSDLSRVLELEWLTAAAKTRLCLWQAVTTVFVGDRRVSEMPLARRIEQTRQQIEDLDRFRLEAVMEAFSCLT